MAPTSTPAVTNVVFDMGGVLLDWDPMGYCSRFTDGPDDARLVHDALFGSTAWPLADAGVFDDDTVLMVAHSALPERLHDACDRTYRAFPGLQRVIEPTNVLGARLKEAGLGVYLLSNVGLRFHDEFEPRIPLCRDMDGIMTSAEELLMKPDPAIFRLFCDRFSLEAKTCLFVDDAPVNCEGARRAGWHAFHFTGDVAALAREVSRLTGVEL